MQQCEYHFERFEPESVLVARELLKVANEIILNKAADPEHPFGSGPSFEIIRNVVKALDYCRGATKLTREALMADAT